MAKAKEDKKDSVETSNEDPWELMRGKYIEGIKAITTADGKWDEKKAAKFFPADKSFAVLVTKCPTPADYLDFCCSSVRLLWNTGDSWKLMVEGLDALDGKTEDDEVIPLTQTDFGRRIIKAMNGEFAKKVQLILDFVAPGGKPDEKRWKAWNDAVDGLFDKTDKLEKLKSDLTDAFVLLGYGMKALNGLAIARSKVEPEWLKSSVADLDKRSAAITAWIVSADDKSKLDPKRTLALARAFGAPDLETALELFPNVDSVAAYFKDALEAGGMFFAEDEIKVAEEKIAALSNDTKLRFTCIL